MKKDSDGLEVRQRILDIYSKTGFDGIDPGDLRGRMRWMGLYTQRAQGIPGGKTAVLEPEELEDSYFMLRIRIDGGQLSAEQLRAGQRPAVGPQPHHEVGVLELLGLQHGGLPAGDALGPLGVEPHPPHAAAQVARVDAPEAGVRVDVQDALADLEPVGVLLHPLVGVERLPVAQRPLALATLRPVARAGSGHGGTSFCAGRRGAGPDGVGAAGSGGAAGAAGDRGQRAGRQTALLTSARSM